LSLQNRLAIADGLAANKTMTAIADGIGKSLSTVSREIDRHCVSRACICRIRPIRTRQRHGAAQNSPNWSPTRNCARPSMTG
jgi:IS30 family transposase